MRHLWIHLCLQHFHTLPRLKLQPPKPGNADVIHVHRTVVTTTESRCRRTFNKFDKLPVVGLAKFDTSHALQVTEDLVEDYESIVASNIG